MSNLFYGVYLVGFLPFLFFYWRRLKEDYTSTQIFTSGFYIISSILITSLIFVLGVSRLIHPSAVFSTSGLWFWGGIVGFMVGLGISIFRLNLKFFETFEAGILGSFFWLSIIFLINSVKDSSLVSLIGFGVMTLLIFLFFFLEGKYKKFTWYRSGKIGFSGLAVSGIFFFARACLALFFPFVLSFVGKLDALISGAISFILFLLLYNLSEYDK